MTTARSSINNPNRFDLMAITLDSGEDLTYRGGNVLDAGGLVVSGPRELEALQAIALAEAAGPWTRATQDGSCGHEHATRGKAQGCTWGRVQRARIVRACALDTRADGSAYLPS